MSMKAKKIGIRMATSFDFFQYQIDAPKMMMRNRTISVTEKKDSV